MGKIRKQIQVRIDKDSKETNTQVNMITMSMVETMHDYYME